MSLREVGGGCTTQQGFVPAAAGLGKLVGIARLFAKGVRVSPAVRVSQLSAAGVPGKPSVHLRQLDTR